MCFRSKWEWARLSAAGMKVCARFVVVVASVVCCRLLENEAWRNRASHYDWCVLRCFSSALSLPLAAFLYSHSFVSACTQVITATARKVFLTGALARTQPWCSMYAFVVCCFSHVVSGSLFSLGF